MFSFVSSCIHIEILGEIFPDYFHFFFSPPFFFLPPICLCILQLFSVAYVPLLLLTALILSYPTVCVCDLSLSPSHTLFHICSWWPHSSRNVSFPLLPRAVSSLFYGLVAVRSTTRESVCVWGLMQQELQLLFCTINTWWRDLQITSRRVSDIYRADSPSVSGLNFKKKLYQINLL